MVYTINANSEGPCWANVHNIPACNAAGEFSILHSPPSLTFLGSVTTLESSLKEIIAASLGLSVDEDTEWKGMLVDDPFDTPEAVVLVYIDGVSNLGEFKPFNTVSYPLTIDENELNIFETVKRRIKHTKNNNPNKLVNVKLSDPSEVMSHSLKVFGTVKLGKISKQPLSYLKLSTEEDYQFLRELEALKAVTEQIWTSYITPDNVIDFFNFHFTSLHALSDYHGPNSFQTKEAKKLLVVALEELNKAFVKVYYGSVLVSVVVAEVAHTRRIRTPDDEPEELPEAEPEAPAPAPAPAPEENNGGNGGNGDDFNADYPIIFNIMLWFGVVYMFSLIAIVYAMVDMDPGRDSIIYRMTNTKLKKEL